MQIFACDNAQRVVRQGIAGQNITSDMLLARLEKLSSGIGVGNKRYVVGKGCTPCWNAAQCRT